MSPTLPRPRWPAGSDGTGERRIPLIVNAAPWRESVPASVFEQATWLILNRSEVSGLLGLSLSDLASITDAVSAWRSTGDRPGVVVTLGAEGAWVDGGGMRELVKAVTVERVVDTVGAGDAFVGGFVVALMEGMGAMEAARFAAAVAAISVGRPGAQDAMPQRGGSEGHPPQLPHGTGWRRPRRRSRTIHIGAVSRAPAGWNRRLSPRRRQRGTWVRFTGHLRGERLPGAIQLSFADGHAGLVPLEQLWTLTGHRG